MTNAPRPSMARIGLIGDYRSDIEAHIAIPHALALAGKALDTQVLPTWIETAWLERHDVAKFLEDFDGLWCVPASPYASQGAVLEAITWARSSGTAFLGTCGGFQHALIEYVRTELGHANANSIEDDPATSLALISQLSCALRGVSDAIHVAGGSRLGGIYCTGIQGADSVADIAIEETYNCGFGLDPGMLGLFRDTPLNIVAYDADGDPKAFELQGHPFFIGTAFQPERSAFKNTPHPLVQAFIKVAANR